MSLMRMSWRRGKQLDGSFIYIIFHNINSLDDECD